MGFVSWALTLVLVLAAAGQVCWQPPLTQFATEKRGEDIAAAVEGQLKQAVRGLREAMTKWAIPSLSYVIQYRGTILAIGGLGIANATSKAPASPDTLYRIG